MLKNRNWNTGFMQKHVVTLDMAKRMKTAGWSDPVTFHWWADEHTNGRFSLGRVENELCIFPAPMVDELLESLPRGSIKICSGPSVFLVQQLNADQKLIGQEEKYRLVDALAEIWISHQARDHINKHC